MGQFLAIGIATKVSAEKTKVDKAQINIEQLQNEMKQKLHYAPELYGINENADYYDFVLKDEIFHAQLIPLLEAIYPLLYTHSTYYQHIIEKLNTLSPSEWFPWAEEKAEEAFQFDAYGMWDTLEKNNVRIRLYYGYLLLSLEGKIMMEVFGRQFNFLNYAMMQTFNQFSLAGALRIYISG